MESWETFQRLGIALGLGLIVGLQRERSGSILAGFRTFPLVTLFGALAGLLAEEHGGWVLGGGLAALGALIVVGNLEHEEKSPGLTTEMAMLVMFAVGALLAAGPVGIAVAVGGTVAVLLHLKPQMHSAARGIGDADFKAIMQFVLITLVILPILPNQQYGPYGVLNPHKIWLMVVLIVGISLGGYVAYKFMGEKTGALLGGILGGLISSTATTVSYARRAKATGAGAASHTAALVILVASTVVFARVLVIIGASAPNFLPRAAAPLGVMLGAMLILCLLWWWRSDKATAALPPQGNPSELKGALLFAGLYAVVLIAAAAAKEHFGTRGLYAVAVISGLTDMDAITLSISEMAAQNKIEAGEGWRLILTAALANLVFKGAMVSALGNRELLGRVAGLFGVSFAVGLGLILFWP